MGQRSFDFHGPTVWNSLPPALRDRSLFQRTCFSGGERLICLNSHEQHPSSLWRFTAILATDMNIMTYLLAYFRI